MGEKLERVDKGLKRLKEAMDAEDIKRVCVHHRAMMSDLAYVKGIVKAAAERENWTEEQVSELCEKVQAKVAESLELAENMLDVADVRAKDQWAEQFFAAARRVQSLAANAHQYLTPEDWTRENTEEFLEDLRGLRSNAKKLMMTVPLEACQPSMRKAIQVADRQMEETYVMAKNVAVNLLKKHKAAKRGRNRNLTENEDYDEDYCTRHGTPTDWEETSNSEGGEHGQPRRERECSTENELSDDGESHSQDNGTVPPVNSQFRPLEVTVMSGR